jgi:DNA-binding NarL/FixJ family response regulator
VRVALADDSALFRRGLRRLLEELGIQVVAECATGEALLHALALDGAIDAVVLDIRMPPTYTNEGLTAAAQIRRAYPHVGVLVLSTYADSTYAEQLLESGSSHLGYLLKDRVDDAATVRETLARLCEGGSVLDPEVVARVVNRSARTDPLGRLTERERDILAAMAEGRSNSGISQRLFLSPKTIEAHINSIFTKLDLPNEADANRRVRAVLHWLNAKQRSGG